MFVLAAAATGPTEEELLKILPRKFNRRLHTDGDAFFNLVSRPCNVKQFNGDRSGGFVAGVWNSVRDIRTKDRNWKSLAILGTASLKTGGFRFQTF